MLLGGQRAWERKLTSGAACAAAGPVKYGQHLSCQWSACRCCTGAGTLGCAVARTLLVGGGFEMSRLSRAATSQAQKVLAGGQWLRCGCLPIVLYGIRAMFLSNTFPDNTVYMCVLFCQGKDGRVSRVYVDSDLLCPSCAPCAGVGRAPRDLR